MIIDPIADMLTRIRNAQMIQRIDVRVPYSNFKKALLDQMKKEGYITDFSIEDSDQVSQKQIRIKLKYYKGRGVIESMRKVSKASLRHYVGKDDLPKVKNGLGVAFISTNQGLMSDKQARKAGLGGEVICEIY